MGNWSENRNSRERRIVIKEVLVEGQDCAFQLRQLLLLKDDNSSSYDDLTLKILTSFNEALSSLHNSTTTTSSDDNNNNQNNSCVDQVDYCSTTNLNATCSNSQLVIDHDSSAFSDDRSSEHSGHSTIKRPSPNKTSRASYKRKKTCGSLTKVSPVIEDGHAWRKYGQKDILNSKYPRSYFRCTHKYDQGCKATKQVQRKEEEDEDEDTAAEHIMYLITYIGNHTCSSPFLFSPPPVPHPDPNNNNNKDYSTTTTTLLIKEESKTTTTTTVPSSTHHHDVIWKNCLMTFNHHHHHHHITSPVLDNNLLQTINDFATTPPPDHDFQYLDESDFLSMIS